MAETLDSCGEIRRATFIWSGRILALTAATVRMFGLDVVSDGLQSCLNAILDGFENDTRGQSLACLNPHSLVIAQADDRFAEALRGAHLLVPDGIGVLAAARLLGLPVQGRITGSDVFWGLSHRLNQTKTFNRYFFLGSTEPELDALVKRLRRTFSSIEIAGTYAPPFAERFTEDENRRIVNAINHARPDVLWVGMTAPRQEKWVADHLPNLDLGLAASVGAVFDYVSGRAKRPPRPLRYLGLEWFGRMLRDPRRMAPRILSSGPRFARMVATEWRTR